MNARVRILRALPLGVFVEPHEDDDWATCPLALASDSTLVETVAAAIAPPKVTLPSSFTAASFILHAPLELLARASLLRHVAPESRAEARRRIAEIAVRYAALGPEIEERPKIYEGVEVALSALRSALQTGDVAEVDRTLLFLLARVSPRRIRAALADDVAPALGAAAHAPILLNALHRMDDLNGIAALLRAPLSLIAAGVDQRLTWVEGDFESSSSGSTARLFERLAAPDPVTVSSRSIAATMLGVERDGFAQRKLTDVTQRMRVTDARQVLLRVAALSMLCDDTVHAPYGWTHSLTLPQAVLELEDVISSSQRLVRIAATHALGFRATLGTLRLELNYTPPRPPDDVLTHVVPEVAAAAAYHAAASKRSELWTLLATRAGTHPDAHLAKYTLACLQASIADPEAAQLYQAAAAYLSAWWDAHPGEAPE